MALKKCFKLHKLFLAELERIDRIDKEGAQVLSSLANVAKRVPLLAGAAAPQPQQQSSSFSSSSDGAFGVLSFVADAPALLLEKHFLAMEKSATFLRDIVKDLVDTLRRLRGFVDEFVDLVDETFAEDASSAASAKAALQMLEWMENVRTMHERETLRKRLLVADFEYQDVARLQRMHRAWPAGSTASFVDVAYVRMATEVLPPLAAGTAPVESRDATLEEDGDAGGRAAQEPAASTKSKKSKKKKPQANT